MPQCIVQQGLLAVADHNVHGDIAKRVHCPCNDGDAAQERELLRHITACALPASGGYDKGNGIEAHCAPLCPGALARQWLRRYALPKF